MEREREREDWRKKGGFPQGWPIWRGGHHLLNVHDSKRSLLWHKHTHTHRRCPRGLDRATTTLPITSILLMRSGRGLLMRITFKWTCPPSLFPHPLYSALPPPHCSFCQLPIHRTDSWHIAMVTLLTSDGTWPSRRSKQNWSLTWHVTCAHTKKTQELQLTIISIIG